MYRQKEHFGKNRKKYKVDNQIPHYEVIFERVEPDYCKAILKEGVKIEYDLKDFGIVTGFPYTLSVKNPVYPLLVDEPYFHFFPKEEKPQIRQK
jgi:hypothetical protein